MSDELGNHDVFIEDANPTGSEIPLPSTSELGWLLVGGGVAGVIINLIRERRGLVDLAVPIGLASIGLGVLLQRRQSNMEAAEENILAELDALDPVARAQVLKAVAKDELSRVPGIGSSEN
jgi:hypothetical protein